MMYLQNSLEKVWKWQICKLFLTAVMFLSDIIMKFICPKDVQHDIEKW